MIGSFTPPPTFRTDTANVGKFKCGDDEYDLQA